ncbi:odorant receptor 221 [Nasonia vitripennis]|uniref:Odorant receptor n=1 Tax=Nasonia vitripennis TaxID=7425 RepID=A0A7M6UPS0_NASVI|nr:odorant receptor 221 [Nasonia vitripennis]
MRGAMSAEPKDLRESFTFLSISSSHLIFMRMFSYLPLKGKSFSHPLSRLLQLWNHFAVFGFNAMWQGYGIRMIQRGDVEVDFLCEDIITIGFTIRYIVMRIKREQLCRLVESCEKLWDLLEDGEAVFVRKFERKGYYFRTFILCNALLMAGSYSIAAPFVRLPPLEANGTERKILPFRFFMDVQEEPAYSIVFVLQSIALQFLDFMMVMTETISLYLIMMACGYLRSVRNRLLNLKGSDSDPSEKGEAALKAVVGCAHFHQQIMIYCEDLSKMTETLFLISCFCPIYNVSVTCLVILNTEEDNLKFVPLMLYNFFQFFLCQWAPEHLTVESDNIAEAAYFASLQPQAPSHREKINRILYYMMMRAQKPVQLTAGGFAPLSIKTFGAMTKNAFSFFMVLRNFKN